MYMQSMMKVKKTDDIEKTKFFLDDSYFSIVALSHFSNKD